MAVVKGKVKAGSTFFGLYLPFKFPLFPRRYAVYAEGKRHRVSKQCDPFVGEPIRQLAGHEVEILTTQKEIYAIRSLEPLEPELKIIIITCYLMPLAKAFPWEVIQGIRPEMNKILVDKGVIEAEVADMGEQWHAQAHG